MVDPCQHSPHTLRRLALEPATRTARRRTRLGGHREEPIAHYLAITVDGRRLEDLVEHGRGLVSPLQRWWLERMSPVDEELLGRTEGLRLADGFAPIRYLAPGRVPLLVCPWDGEIGCGWLTCRVDVGEDHAVWDDFRWENGGIGEAAPVRGLPQSLAFARQGYESVLRSINTTALPEVDPDGQTWRRAEHVPGVPHGLEGAWGAVARLRWGR